MKVCLEPGCPKVQPEPRCPAHRRDREQQRGTRQHRGYDAEHDRQRAKWAPLVATGNVKCWRCGDYIAASAAWDLGHDDRDRSTYRGPEHVGRECKVGGNRATAARRISPDA